MDRESVQRVLRDRRRAHEARACYPCQQRKVKCDKSQPCRTCQRRGHPEICTSFDVQTSGSQQRRPGRDSSRRRTPPGMAGERERQATRPGVSAAGIASPGQDSVSAILTSKVSSPNDEPLARDVRAVLGLQNTLTSYLFMEHNAQGDAVDALMAIAPQRNDIVRFYQHYRTHVAPFNPILLNTDRFELDLSAYLKAEAAGELRNRQKLVEGQWASRNGVSFIALLLSIVASGAHFSDDRESTSASHTFAKRSFHALRLANFLFQPSTSDIQTLLILGNTLQNTGQSDAAWALLGTTVRLAQTIAFTSDGDLGINREAVTETQLLRSRVVWQDALLSICHDRPPAIYGHGWLSESRVPAASNLSYASVMNIICCLSIEFMQRKALDVRVDQLPADILRHVDEAYGRASSHLHEVSDCKDLAQLLEHYALKMHVSFFVTYVCRPAIRNSARTSGQPSNNVLRVKARENLVNVCESFLEFQALSIVPRRTWSILHEALSAALLLYAWDETRDNTDCRRLQQQVVDVFAADTANAAYDGLGSGEIRWLSPQHIRTLLSLREALGQDHPQHVPAEQPPLYNPTGSSSGLYTDADTSNATDPYFFQPSLGSSNQPLGLDLSEVGMDGLSPLAYLNYFMNGPVTNSLPNDGPYFQ